MSKLRKYDKKNKLRIMFIVFLSSVILILFTLVAITMFKKENKSYVVNKNSVTHDINNKLIRVKKTANIKSKWNNNWYLDYDNQKYNLGVNAIVYNEFNADVTLFGNFYEVREKGEINKTNENLVLKSPDVSKFYKISDRKYLLIDPVIVSSNLSTSNYLVVDIEKSGYAFYTNNKVNVKTVGETVIRTSTYEFDVNNETLKFNDNSEIINLKKILGSTNNYKSNKKENNIKNNDSDININQNSNQTTVDRVTSDTNNIIQNIVNNSSNLLNIMKRTSIVGINTTYNSLAINYIIYDPANEYYEVYANLNNQKYLLSKNSNLMIIDSLLPNQEYNLEFYYSYTNKDGILKNVNFDSVKVKTKNVDVDIAVNRIANNNIYYEISDLPNLKNFNYNIELYYNDLLINSSLNLGNKTICKVDNKLNCIELNAGNYMIKLVDVSYNGIKISDDIYYKFSY